MAGQWRARPQKAVSPRKCGKLFVSRQQIHFARRHLRPRLWRPSIVVVWPLTNQRHNQRG